MKEKSGSIAKKIESFWHDFINGKIDRNPGIREEVFESWLRSREYNINPYMEKIPITIRGQAIAEELERNRELLAVARPVVEDIYSVVKGSRSGVWLSNEKGIILYRIADTDILEEVEKRGFSVGADWSEEAAGTNAVGTALIVRKPIQITFAEHYVETVRIGVCSGAPIWGPDGEIMGILNVTGFWQEHHPHTLGMVVAGVGAIQREFGLRALNQKLQISHQYVLEMIESLPSGVIVVDQDGTITSVNKRAGEMLKSPLDTFLNKNIFETLGRVDCLKKTLKTGTEIEETEFYYENGKQKIQCTLTGRPIKTPFGDIDGAVVILREIDAVRRITSKIAGYSAKFSFNNIIGEEPSVKDVLKKAETASAAASNILILGESGTGKEVLAQAIHNASPRANGPFVAINCGALPRELIGSELFGYEEGAFTGAKKGGSPGKFELANNGTLFLDEIGDMPLDLQLMLLRVLQERVVVRLGGQKELPVNVRLIAATNKNLGHMIENGLYRQDLYYRLNVVTLELPPLRNRKSDIGILAKYFLKNQSEKLGKEIYDIDPKALELLEQYNWPGNIRELENIIERAAIFSNGTTLHIESLDTLREGKRTSFEGFTILGQENKLSLKSGEKAIIETALHEYNGNISRAAQKLGITRATMYRKLRSYGVID